MENQKQVASVETANLIVGSLLACGVTTFAYCSGSRNAPFAYALAEYEKQGLVNVYTFAEERGAAFWALGWLQGATGSGEMVAVVTTSGTAVAELHPAVEEAKHQGLPLIVVTADRPFEMRGVGANQTTDQVGIFGPSVVAQIEVPAMDNPEAPVIARALKGRVQRLAARSAGHGGLPGPVHLNVCLREPLSPSHGVLPVDPETTASPSPVTGPLYSSSSGVPWAEVVDDSLRTVLVAGDGDGKHDSAKIRKVAEYASQIGIPLIAEPSSGLCDLSSWLPHGPLVAARLEQEADRDELSGVEQVIVVGRPTLSRQVDALLSRMGKGQTRKIIVSANERWQDTSGTATVVVSELVPGAEASALQGSVERRVWQQYCRQIAADMESVVRDESKGLNHLGVARMIWRHSRETDLWLGASNVIRSFDLGAPAPGVRYVFSNRGLAGIDGTIASALGLQKQTQRPVRVVLGDLSFCYDLASLAARPCGDQDIQLIVFDDGGGSIFHSLEHGGATSEDMYRKFFGVPQNLDICAVGQACGWVSTSAESMEQLREIVMAPIRGRSLVRVPLSLPTGQFRATFVSAGVEAALTLSERSGSSKS